MQNKEHLEKAVADAARAVDESKSAIAGIEAQQNAASLALTRAKKQREQHALAAAMGDPAAVNAIKQARAEQLAAEQVLADLDLALPGARASLIELQKALASAQRARAQFEADILRRQRIDPLAGQIDQAIAVLDGLVQQYLKLGREILHVDAPPPNMHMIDTMSESVLGERRLRAAVPKSLERVLQSPVHDEQPKESLAVTESRFWNLPPEREAKAA